MGKRIIYNNSLNAELMKKIRILAARLGKRHNDLLEEAIKDMLNKYKTGISFKGTHAQNIHFAKELIKSYHYKKDEYRYSSGSERKTAVM
jgi:hypothetical protein